MNTMLTSRLFWKFFLSMMFVVLLTVFLSIHFEKFVRQHQSPQTIQQTIEQLVGFRDEVIVALQAEDFATLEQLLADNPQYSQQIIIFDDSNHKILQQQAFHSSPMRHRFNHHLTKEFAEQGIHLNTRVVSNFGKVFYLKMQPTMTYSPLFSPRTAGTLVRVGLLLIFTAMVCYLLTRMLIVRINRLQHATQQLAHGNYQASILNLPQPLFTKEGGSPPFSKVGESGKNETVFRPLARQRLCLREGGFEKTLTRFGRRFNRINDNDELGQLEKAFYQMSQQLATSQQQRKQMLSDISHELRSPLTRMQIALALVEDKFPESQPYITRAEKETQRMGELISQIIQLQKLSLYGQEEKKQSIDLIKLISDIINDANYEYQQQNKQAQLQTRLQICPINGNEEQLHSAFENIIRNGLSHSKTDSTVEVSIEKNKQNYHIEIKDYGGGIDEEVLTDKSKDIFQPFVRLDSSRNRKTGGYGLGLSIAKTIIEQHNGTITADNHYSENHYAESRKRVGLVMRVGLPC